MLNSNWSLEIANLYLHFILYRIKYLIWQIVEFKICNVLFMELLEKHWNKKINS